MKIEINVKEKADLIWAKFHCYGQDFISTS